MFSHLPPPLNQNFWLPQCRKLVTCFIIIGKTVHPAQVYIKKGVALPVAEADFVILRVCRTCSLE